MDIYGQKIGQNLKFLIYGSLQYVELALKCGLNDLKTILIDRFVDLSILLVHLIIIIIDWCICFKMKEITFVYLFGSRELGIGAIAKN